MPLQILDAEGVATIESDVNAWLVDTAASLAERRGVTLERVIEQILRGACRRVG